MSNEKIILTIDKKDAQKLIDFIDAGLYCRELDIADPEITSYAEDVKIFIENELKNE